ncbi:hypothetical protein BKA63DRAFT_575252 [Paraphoma chrysanthemicola]|nr:hypothetical protein BKA63DRAFT_575252 [Paraphoma chrysanthemicola]
MQGKTYLLKCLRSWCLTYNYRYDKFSVNQPQHVIHQDQQGSKFAEGQDINLTGLYLRTLLIAFVKLLTRGASGIGAAIVRLAFKSGAHVVFGDLNEVLGRQVAAETGATFLNRNAAEYLDILNLFQEAHKRFGTVDHAVSNAGIYEPKPDPFDVSLDLESVKEVPSTTVFDVNVRGTAYFSRIALAYFRQNATAADDKSLILISSVSGVVCPPDTPFYNVMISSAVVQFAPTFTIDIEIRCDRLSPYSSSESSGFAQYPCEHGLSVRKINAISQIWLAHTYIRLKRTFMGFTQASHAWVKKHEPTLLGFLACCSY